MIKKFKTKPQEIEAIQFIGTKESFDEIRAWVGDSFYYDYQSHPRVFLDNMTRNPVNKNDWIAKQGGKFSVMSMLDISWLVRVTDDKKAIFQVE